MSFIGQTSGTSGSTAGKAQNITATYSFVSSVPNSSLTSIVTYTVPVSKTSTLQRVIVSGENIAKYDVLINGSTISTKRTYFGGELNIDFIFTGYNGGGIKILAGDVVTVKVLHNRPSVANFEGTIEVIET